MSSLKEQLKRHEGFRGSPYRCPAGFLTIGYGHNLNAVPIPEHIADMLLDTDISKARGELARVFPEAWDLTSTRIDVLVNMIFNLGRGGFMGFTNMLHAIRHGNHDAVPGHMLDSKWAKQVGRRATELAEQWAKG